MSVSTPTACGTPASTEADTPTEVTGISLACTDMTADSVEHRTYWFTRTSHPVIDLVRANIVKAGGPPTSDGNDGESAARATFSSPVMSRRHARISFEDDGKVSVVDLSSLHGTYVRDVKLDPNVPFTLESGDTIVLGKGIRRDDKNWEPVSLQVSLELAPAKGTKELTPASNVFIASTPPSVDSDGEGDEDEKRSTPNRYGVHMYSSPSYHSSDMSDSDDMDTSSSISQSGDDDDSQNDAFGSPDLDDEHPTSSSSESPSVTNKLCSILPFDLGRYATSSRLPLPSLRDLGFFTSATARSNGDGNKNEASACTAPPAPAPPLHHAPEKPEPPMACLAPSINGSENMTMNCSTAQAGTGQLDNNFPHANNTVDPPDNSSNMFFPSYYFSQSLPSFPQNQLGALDFTNDFHDYSLRLPGSLDGSDSMIHPSLSTHNMTVNIPESTHDALPERSCASSPMDLSSGRASPEPEDSEPASETSSEIVRNNSVAVQGGDDVDAEAEDLPRSSLFLPPKEVNITDPVVRTPSPEIAEISREAYMQGSKSTKDAATTDANESEDTNSSSLRRIRSLNAQRRFRSNLFDGPLGGMDATKLGQPNTHLGSTSAIGWPFSSLCSSSSLQNAYTTGLGAGASSPPGLWRRNFSDLSTPLEDIIKEARAEQQSLSTSRPTLLAGAWRTNLSNTSTPLQDGMNARVEQTFSSLPTKIQALVASEMNNVTSRITDLKESIGGLRPLVERQIAATLAMAAARSASEADRAPVDANPSPPPAISEAEAKKELQDIREEMLRFSAIMEQVLAKIEPLRVQSEQAIQAGLVGTEDLQVTSRKRKFSDVEVDEAPAMLINCTSEDDVHTERPTKRARTPTGSVTRSVATAAGFTSLGAILTFVTFAYLL